MGNLPTGSRDADAHGAAVDGLHAQRLGNGCWEAFPMQWLLGVPAGKSGRKSVELFLILHPGSQPRALQLEKIKILILAFLLRSAARARPVPALRGSFGNAGMPAVWFSVTSREEDSF